MTYDVKPVLNITNYFSCSDEATLEIRTKAVATLMSLTTAQTLQSLKIDLMYQHEHCIIFYIFKLLKSTRPEFH